MQRNANAWPGQCQKSAPRPYCGLQNPGSRSLRPLRSPPVAGRGDDASGFKRPAAFRWVATQHRCCGCRHHTARASPARCSDPCGKTTRAQEDVRHSLNVMSGLNRVLTSLLDAETGQRGYVITQNPDYLEPFDQATPNILAEIGMLRELTNGDPDYRTLRNLVASPRRNLMS